MLFPISHIYEKETNKRKRQLFINRKKPEQKTHNKNNPLK